MTKNDPDSEYVAQYLTKAGEFLKNNLPEDIGFIVMLGKPDVRIQILANMEPKNVKVILQNVIENWDLGGKLQ